MAAGSPRYLVDTSALSRMAQAAVASVLSPILTAGLVARCGILELEVFFSARRHTDLVATRRRWEAGLPQVPMLQADFDRAGDVMEALARAGKHRSVPLPDLLLAAVAERAGLTLIHYDADFDLIAEVTGQPCEWVARRGSLS